MSVSMVGHNVCVSVSVSVSVSVCVHDCVPACVCAVTCQTCPECVYVHTHIACPKSVCVHPYMTILGLTVCWVEHDRSPWLLQMLLSADLPGWVGDLRNPTQFSLHTPI